MNSPALSRFSHLLGTTRPAASVVTSSGTVPLVPPPAAQPPLPQAAHELHIVHHAAAAAQEDNEKDKETDDDEEVEDDKKGKKGKKAKAEDEDDKEARAEGDDESDRDDSRNASARAARARERGRIAAIFNSPEGRANPKVAERVAFTTHWPRSEAIAMMAMAKEFAAQAASEAPPAMPQRENLRERMSATGTPNVGISGSDQPISLAQQIINAGKKRRGEI